MKIAEAHRYDPLLGMSYHDLVQETRRLKRANRKLERAVRRLVEEEKDCTEFVCSNPTPNPKLWRGGEPKNTRQTLLLLGLDRLLGQQDLFAVDSAKQD